MVHRDSHPNLQRTLSQQPTKPVPVKAEWEGKKTASDSKDIRMHIVMATALRDLRKSDYK